MQEVAAFYGYTPLASPGTVQARSAGGRVLNLPGPFQLPGGGAGGQLSNLLNEANQANNQRYGQALDVNASGKGEQMGILDSGQSKIEDLLGSGVQESRTRNDMATKRDLGGVKSDLARRGLLNSTILGAETENVKDRANLRDRELLGDLGQREIGVLSHFTDEKNRTAGSSNAQREGIIESKSDIGPNLPLYANLLSQSGGAGGGFVGGGGGGPLLAGINVGGGAGGGNFGSIGGGGGFGQLSNANGSPFNFNNALSPPRYEAPSAGANPYGGKLYGGNAQTGPASSGGTDWGKVYQDYLAGRQQDANQLGAAAGRPAGTAPGSLASVQGGGRPPVAPNGSYLTNTQYAGLPSWTLPDVSNWKTGQPVYDSRYGPILR